MLVPGAYFRNEVIWRGRVIAFMYELKGTLYEFGAWGGAMYVAFAASKWLGSYPMIALGAVAFILMLTRYLDERRNEGRIETGIRKYFDEQYPER
jgi:hypothetical protein